ncbi:MAG TPA: RNA polymerase factor sigma-54 [Chitinophagaceae bacterium]
MLHQNLSQKQHLKILPQQIQLLNLFHLNSLELEQRINQEIEENPLLDEVKAEEEPANDKELEVVQDFQDYDEFENDDIPDYKTECENYWHTENFPERPIAEIVDFRKDLKMQFHYLDHTPEELVLAEFIIDSLNNHGMLDQDVQTLADDFSFKHHRWVEVVEIENLLAKIQQLEPIGIGSRSISECFLLQLLKMNQKRPDVRLATLLVENHFNDLRRRNLEKIMHELSIEEDELVIIMQLIGKLKMKPIAESASSTEVNQNILPDFIIVQEDDFLEAFLYKQRSSSLHINSSWKEMIEAKGDGLKADKATQQYLKNKLNAAQWFVNAIRQREGTMLKVIKAILHFQYDYFKEGDVRLLKPMILKNIADMIGVDISTVSRITCNKYVETPFGTILLKDLFTEGIANEKGQVISNRVIQTTLEELIQNEDKKNPYTDQQLVTILAEKGFSIARRTVAKYREQLQIPVAQMRSLWA